MERKVCHGRPPVVLMVLGGIMLFFMAAPVLSVLLKIDGDFVRLWLWDTEMLRAIGLSFAAAGCATAIAVVFGVPLAYVCARYAFPGRSIVEGIITLPILIPHVAAGVALLVTFGKGSLLGRALEASGLEFIDNFAGIVAAMLFVSFTYLFAAVREGFAAASQRTEAMGRMLGASGLGAFWTVSLGQTRRHIVSGAVMMWARGISEFGAVVIIAYHPMVASVLVYRRLNEYGLSYAQPVVIMLILIGLGLLAPMLLLKGRRGQ